MNGNSSDMLLSSRDEDPICAGGGGKGCKSFPWKNNPNAHPPLLFPGLRFFSKPAFSVLLHNTMFCSIRSFCASRSCSAAEIGISLEMITSRRQPKVTRKKNFVLFGQWWEKWAVECKQPDACRTSPSLEWPRDGDQPPRAQVTAQAIQRTKSKVTLEFGNEDLKALQGNPKVALPSLCPPVSFGFLACMHAAPLMTILVILRPGSLERV